MNILGENGHRVTAVTETVILSVFHQGETKINSRIASKVTIYGKRLIVLWRGEIEPITYELEQGDMVMAVKIQ